MAARLPVLVHLANLQEMLCQSLFFVVVVLYFLTNEERGMKEFQIWPEGPASSGSDKPQKKRKTVAAKEISVWGSLFFFYIYIYIMTRC